MDGVPPNEVMWEFFVGECGGIDGIFQEDQEGVQAYPVPFEDQLFLGNVGVSPATYHMHDVRGVVVRTGRVGSDGLVHGLGDLPAGCYLLRVGESIFQVVK